MYDPTTDNFTEWIQQWMDLYVLSGMMRYLMDPAMYAAQNFPEAYYISYPHADFPEAPAGGTQIQEARFNALCAKHDSARIAILATIDDLTKSKIGGIHGLSLMTLPEILRGVADQSAPTDADLLARRGTLHVFDSSQPCGPQFRAFSRSHHYLQQHSQPVAPRQQYADCYGAIKTSGAYLVGLNNFEVLNKALIDRTFDALTTYMVEYCRMHPHEETTSSVFARVATDHDDLVANLAKDVAHLKAAAGAPNTTSDDSNYCHHHEFFGHSTAKCSIATEVFKAKIARNAANLLKGPTPVNGKARGRGKGKK